MTFQKQLASYQTARETLHNTRQIVLLYDTAIRYVQQAQQAIEEKKYENRFKLLEKAGQIIIGLNSVLDHKNGGEIAKILSSFYTQIELRISKINQTNNLTECAKVIKELKDMRESWAKIDEQFSTTPANTSVAAYTKPKTSEGANFEA